MQNNTNEQQHIYNEHSSGNNSNKSNLEVLGNELPLSTMVNKEIQKGQMDITGCRSNIIHNGENVENGIQNDSAINKNKENLGKI